MNAPLTTSLFRRDPTRPMTSFFDDLFDDLWRPAWLTSRLAEMPGLAPARMDVVDQGERYLITVDLPGVTKDNIEITVAAAQVRISGEAKEQDETKEGDRVLYSERYASRFERSFELPVEVTEEGAEARFDNGVLTLTLPKRAPQTSRRLAVS